MSLERGTPSMRNADRASLTLGLVLSGGAGVWHFFVPYAYHWYRYIPDAPRGIVVSIDWINFFFSLLLTGDSALLLYALFSGELARRSRVAVALHGFMVLVWGSRIAITVLHPWAYDTLFWGEVSAFSVVFLLLAVPFVRLRSPA